jgi:hypothetical protein
MYAVHGMYYTEDDCLVVYMVGYFDHATDRTRVNESWRYFF